MNAVVRLLGAANADIQGAQDGYVAKPLVGVWLLGPYLHNGSVPTLRDLLSPPGQRPGSFIAAMMLSISRTSVSSRPGRKPPPRAFGSILRCAATATQGISTAPTWAKRTSVPCSNI